MSLFTKTRALKAALITAAVCGVGSALAAGFSNSFNGNGSNLTIGGISNNVAGTFRDVANGFEAFLYFLAIVFIVLFILAAWKYKKSDGREGSMGLIATYLVLAASSLAAPTLLSSAGASIFGAGATTVNAPSNTGPAGTPTFGN